MKNSGRKQFKIFKPILLVLARILFLFPAKFRESMFNFNKRLGGKLGLGIRYILLKTIAKRIGDNVSIHENVYIHNPENLIIGDNVSIHSLSYIDASGGINIGDDVSVAHGVTIMSTTHTYTSSEISIKYQPIAYKDTIIEDNVWLGAKCTILAGVRVESGAVVGASSVVTKTVRENTIVGGVPARKIKNRI